MQSAQLASLGRAIGDPARAEILTVLAAGRPRSAGELAAIVGLARSTTSRHLSLLLDAGLVAVDPSGRHRFFRLRSAEASELLNLVAMMDLPKSPTIGRRRRDQILTARTCYDHLAGGLGVAIFGSMTERGLLDPPDDEGPRLTAVGHAFLRNLGVDTEQLGLQPRPLTRACLDWEQRTHHLGGGAGAALLRVMLAKRWLRRDGASRAVAVTPAGASALSREFDIPLAPG